MPHRMLGWTDEYSFADSNLPVQSTIQYLGDIKKQSAIYYFLNDLNIFYKQPLLRAIGGVAVSHIDRQIGCKKLAA